jgi:tetratricopeptide (TPR) repeat protein
MAEAEFGRGIVFRDQTRFEDAVRCFDRISELNRNKAVRGLFHSHRAEALNLLGRFQEAFADVSRCLEVAPNDDEALYAGRVGPPDIRRAHAGAGMALAARSRRQSLVSRDAAVPTVARRRLGRCFCSNC